MTSIENSISDEKVRDFKGAIKRQISRATPNSARKRLIASGALDANGRLIPPKDVVTGIRPEVAEE